MEDLVKLRYLVGKGEDRKLKRNIPKPLQALAGKTAWVERIGGLDASRIKERAHRFAFQTDGELRRLKAAARQAPVPSAEGSDALSVELDDLRAQQIAVAYFHQRYGDMLEDGSLFVSRDDPDYSVILAEAGEGRDAALASAAGTIVNTDPRALKLLVEHGAISESHRQSLMKEGWPDALRNHREFQLLCRLIERADLELARLRLAVVQRGELPAINDRLFAGMALRSEKTPTIASPIKSLGDVIALFRDAKKDKVTRSRYQQYEIPIRVLTEHFGPKLALVRITRDECRSLLKFLPRIPKHVTQHFKKMKLTDAANAYEAKAGQAAGRYSEAQKHLQVITTIFDLAVNERWIEFNPWQGLVIDIPANQKKKFVTKSAGYDPFSVEQLNRLFALPLFTGCKDDEAGCHTPGPNIVRRSRYWTPIIALWTGMRMNEILQLEKADIKLTPGGVWYISATDETAQQYDPGEFSKRLKNENSLRDIPVHPMLERFGLIEWVAKRGDGRLFPEATKGSGEKPSDKFSKLFAYNLKAAGVWQARKFVFHSFRGTFNDALRAAGVSREHREAVNGWREQRAMDDRYGHGTKIEMLAAEISKVEFPGLIVEHLLA
jgi:integrase